MPPARLPELTGDVHGEPNEWIVRAALERRYNCVTRRAWGRRLAHRRRWRCGPDRRPAIPFFLADFLRAGNVRGLWHATNDWAHRAADRRSHTYLVARYALGPALQHARGETLEYRAVPIPWATPEYRQRRDLDNRGRRDRWLPRARSVGHAYVLQRVMVSAHIVATQHHHRHIATAFPAPITVPAARRIHVELAAADPSSIRPATACCNGERSQASCRKRSSTGAAKAAVHNRISTDWSEVRRSVAPLPLSRRSSRGVMRKPRFGRDAVRQARVGKMIGLKYFQASASLELWLQRLDALPRVGRHDIAGKARQDTSLTAT